MTSFRARCKQEPEPGVVKEIDTIHAPSPLRRQGHNRLSPPLFARLPPPAYRSGAKQGDDVGGATVQRRNTCNLAAA